MTTSLRGLLGFGVMAALLLVVATQQSWSLALSIVNMCLISAVMALGVNVQWGYAGLFNVGIMGFAALGGVAAVLVSVPPVPDAWRAGGVSMGVSLLLLLATVAALVQVRKTLSGSRLGRLLALLVLVAGYLAIRHFYAPAVQAIEGVNPALTGFLGGLGMPVLFSWLVGGLFAGAAAWLIGRIALGLRSDYLAIATLGISEIVIAIIKNEDWLTRGVKNVTGLPRPVPYELALQQAPWFRALVERWSGHSLPGGGAERAEALSALVVPASSVFVKLCYTGLFGAVLLILLWLAYRAQRAPWGRMMRAIRDNEDAAEAMGKDVTRRHLQVFVLGSAIVGIGGAMLATLEGQLTPGAYNPLRFTFLIWVMVIVGGSGNNIGAVLGAFLIWFFWVQAEPIGQWVVSMITAGLDPANPLRIHLLENASHTRLLMMGVLLLLVLRFSPHGLLPERVRR